MHPFLSKLNAIFARGATTLPSNDKTDEIVDEALFNHYAFVIGSLFSYFNELAE